jgi:UDP-N-acetyl-D-mannosaminuronic acid transferase (WecB/TagA/CpsF family)
MPLALDWIDAAVAARHRGYLCVAATHTVMAAGEDAGLARAVRGADFTVPDGQPLVSGDRGGGGGGGGGVGRVPVLKVRS